MAADGSAVQLDWATGPDTTRSTSFHVRWLYYNAENHVHPTTGQRTIDAAVVASPPAVQRLTMVDGGAGLDVTWASGMVTRFAAPWLREHDYSDAALAEAHTAATPRALCAPGGGDASAALVGGGLVPRRSHSVQPAAASAGSSAVQPRPAHAPVGKDDVPSFDYNDIMASDRAVWEWLTALNETGITLVRNAPTVDRTVLKLAARVAPPMLTIYGDAWDVAVMAKPINIAYAPVGLDVHVDLVYYESAPGLQLLHCRQFDDGVRGGESTFVDGFFAAEELRRRDPAAFATLTRVPATFQKVHYDRASPVHIVAQKPHITVDRSLLPRRVTGSGGPASSSDVEAAAAGDITGVSWAPQFEGPLRVPAADVDEYYAAYAAFAHVLRDIELDGRHLVEYRMSPGDVSVFNNRRMLHGRRNFGAPVGAGGGGGNRLLQGCYVNVDEYKSRLMHLCTQHGGLDRVKRVANLQWF
jgi:alpha-ketoglutarate-dependent taurine dioxygenase